MWVAVKRAGCCVVALTLSISSKFTRRPVTNLCFTADRRLVGKFNVCRFQYCVLLQDGRLRQVVSERLSHRTHTKRHTSNIIKLPDRQPSYFLPTSSIWKTIWYRKRLYILGLYRRYRNAVLLFILLLWLGYVLRYENILQDIAKGKLLGKATRGRKRMKLLHDMMEDRDYGQSKDLISDRSRWRQDSK